MNLAWEQTWTHRSRTLTQWSGPTIETSALLKIQHEFWITPPAFRTSHPGWPAAGELPLPRPIGKATRVSTQHTGLDKLNAGSEAPKCEVLDVMQTSRGVEYEPSGSDAAGSYYSSAPGWTERGRDAA